jgi:hypothetical protein
MNRGCPTLGVSPMHNAWPGLNFAPNAFFKTGNCGTFWDIGNPTAPGSRDALLQITEALRG